MCDIAAFKECLGGDTPSIEAVTAHEPPFDQCHMSATAFGSGCCDQATGSSADDEDVIFSCGGWIHPFDGTNLIKEVAIVLVEEHLREMVTVSLVDFAERLTRYHSMEVL